MAEKVAMYFLQELVHEVFHELMDSEVTQHCDADHHERSDERRLDQRSDYRTRRGDIRAGAWKIHILGLL